MSIDVENYFECEEGQAKLYKLRNASGFGADISDFGGVVVSLFAPDITGKLIDVVLGYDDPENYIDNVSYLGALIGRCAGRIFTSKFSIDGKEYTVSQNAPEASLHGGNKGFSHHLYKSETYETPEGVVLKLTRTSPDGEEGYPGALELEVLYTVTNDNALKIEYRATTDAPTVVNLTNHSYFNLNGTGCNSIKDHQMHVNANTYTPSSENLKPTGEIVSVQGTVLDLTQSKMMKESLDELSEGFDHNYMLNDECRNLKVPAAIVSSLSTGIMMQTFTTEPAIQVYTAFCLGDSKLGKHGIRNAQFSAFCLETQHPPDSPNNPSFPSVILRPGEEYKQTTMYNFSIK
ncbi:MAG: galactose-1-epimerase [Thermoplasmata archaeon]|nr:MAG: galactose-1-epimerase [Thermoplasmata archaeon]